jgi:hypothetical protein
MGDISNNLQPLCSCKQRDLVLGRKAYVCQVCELYDPVKSNQKIVEIYEESRRIAEKKIKEKTIELEDFELAEMQIEDEIDLTIDEFEEEDEEVPLKFEKRKAGKEEIGIKEDFGEIECPFCGEVFEDLASHLPTCEFAPDDASVEDVLPGKSKRKRKTSSSTAKSQGSGKKEKQKCPYCGKEFSRLGRHITSCPKKPKDKDEEEEEEDEDEEEEEEDEDEEDDDEEEDDDFED